MTRSASPARKTPAVGIRCLSAWGLAVLLGVVPAGMMPSNRALATDKGLPTAPAWKDGRVVRDKSGKLALDGTPRQHVACPAESGGDASCQFFSIQDAADAAANGDTIILRPGIYTRGAVLRSDGLTVKAEAGAHIKGGAVKGKAALVVTGDNTVIEGLECSEITVRDRNGACIRQEGRNLTLRNVYFHDSEQGLLGGGDLGTILIEHSRLERLGMAGRAHAIYASGGVQKLHIRHSQILASKGEGHEIKSRAAVTILEHNVIASLDGRDSRLIDLPNGGRSLIRYNILEAGRRSSNRQVIGIGLEGIKHDDNLAVIENNFIILDDRRAKLVASRIKTRLTGNTIVGGSRQQGNKYFRNRKQAGLPPYPALPALEDVIPR